MNKKGFIYSFFKSFGKNPSEYQKKSFASSKNYHNGVFQNIEKEMRQNIPFREIRKITSNKSIPDLISSKKADLKNTNTKRTSIVWFGHSTFLIKYGNWNILVDPILRNNISPLPNYIKAYEGSNVYQVDDLPEIDVLIITHDHFDHMDYESLIDIRPLVKQVIVPLGVSSHLEYWGYPKQIITEMDWYDEKLLSSDINIIATPARHFSGRNMCRNKTLWSSFVLICGDDRLFISGDGGYGAHFKIIGEKYGPIDLAMLENGQYSPYWRNVHTFPFEIAKVMKDLRAKMIFPIHWSKFTLSSHNWSEPMTDLLAANPDFAVTIPQIGESFTIGDPVKNDPWWEKSRNKK